MICRSIDTSMTDGPSPAVINFNYDADRWVATWDYDRPLSLNKYLVALGGSVVDAEANALDGEWTTGVSRFGSGDGTAGGQFAFRFNVVPGDVDGSGRVTLDEAGLVRSKNGKLVTSLGYFYRIDLDGSGGITSAEADETRLRFGTDIAIFSEPVAPGNEPVDPMGNNPPVNPALPLRRAKLNELSLRLRLAIDELMHDRLFE